MHREAIELRASASINFLLRRREEAIEKIIQKDHRHGWNGVSRENVDEKFLFVS